MEEKKVSRGLHGISLGTIVAAAVLVLSQPEKTASLLWYINKHDSIQHSVKVVPRLNSIVFDLRIRMDRMERNYAHKNDSLVDLVQDLQRAAKVLSHGKQPFDSVEVILSSGEKKMYSVNTNWIWRARQ
jgi:hypothetical protein